MRNDIENVSYANLGKKTTVCCLTLESGYEVTGNFTCKPEKVEDVEFRNGKAYDAAIRVLEYKEKNKK